MTVFCFNPQARESLINGYHHLTVNATLFQSAGSREPDLKIQKVTGIPVGFNPQARESLIGYALTDWHQIDGFNPQARESLIEQMPGAKVPTNVSIRRLARA